MKKLISSLILIFAITSFSQVYVNGYTKSNGTYVESHYRSNPNETKLDNYSTRGNSNPYTGKSGTVDYNNNNSYNSSNNNENRSYYNNNTSRTNNSLYNSKNSYWNK